VYTPEPLLKTAFPNAVCKKGEHHGKTERRCKEGNARQEKRHKQKKRIKDGSSSRCCDCPYVKEERGKRNYAAFPADNHSPTRAN
jgi:hypothetical protein